MRTVVVLLHPLAHEDLPFRIERSIPLTASMSEEVRSERFGENCGHTALAYRRLSRGKSDVCHVHRDASPTEGTSTAKRQESTAGVKVTTS
jgi:hypothetical protein